MPTHFLLFAALCDAGVATIEAYNLYCHYVAGLVGHGLSALFSASGLEDPTLVQEKSISNSMGLFLQKTNIIRDYKEDIEQGRTWWPKEIWSV
jgi:farnesyl-diphosphate farnesyltransferase